MGVPRVQLFRKERVLSLHDNFQKVSVYAWRSDSLNDVSCLRSPHPRWGEVFDHMGGMISMSKILRSTS